MISQTFNLTHASNEEHEKPAPNFLEIKQESFEHINCILQEIDKNYPFSILGWLISSISNFGT